MRTLTMRRHHRALALVVALLLTLPLLAGNPGAAQAQDDPTYELNWRLWTQSTPLGSTVARSSSLVEQRLWLDRSITGVTDELTNVDETLTAPVGIVFDCEDFPATITEDTTVSCEVDDLDLTDPLVVHLFEGTFSHDGAADQDATATILNRRPVTHSLVQSKPVSVEVGEVLTLDLDVTNPGSAPLVIRPGSIGFGTSAVDSGSELLGDCDDAGRIIGSTETERFTCTFDAIAQDTSTTLRFSTESYYPTALPLGQGEFNAIQVQLEPSIEVTATADPDQLFDGGTSSVAYSVANSSTVSFDEIRVTVGPNDACVLTEPSGLAGLGDVWTPAEDCIVEPGPGEDTTITVELDYETSAGTATYAPAPFPVDLASDSTGLEVDARYGGVWGPADTFTARDRFPIGGGSGFLAEPVLQVTVSNPGTADLTDVEVTTDLAGCDATFALPAGSVEVFVCDGPEVTADDPTITTSVHASGQVVGGPPVEASDAPGFTAFGIAAAAEVDPSWDGLGTEVPYLVTLSNIGGLELPAVYTEPMTAAGLDCQVAAPAPTAVDGSVTLDGCTLLAGDLVDGVPMVAVAYDSLIAETAPAIDPIDIQLDPWGRILGDAEVDGDPLAGVVVELRLLELLELPRAEASQDLPLAAAATTTSAACTAVGALAESDEGTIVASTTSDADGAFCFGEVPPGDYQIVVAPVADAELTGVTVAGVDGFTTNSPATSEPFFVGFASAALDAPVTASVSFAPTEAEGELDGENEVDGEVEPIVDDAAEVGAADELPDTGASSSTLLIGAMLAILLGIGLLGVARRPRTAASSRGATWS